jgi:hypothetical protein
MAQESSLVVSVAENQKISASFITDVQSLAGFDVESISIRIFGHAKQRRYGNKTGICQSENIGFTPSFQSEANEGSQ